MSGPKRNRPHEALRKRFKSGTMRNRADEALRKRFKTEEQQAVDALARWIGHPAVRGIIERRRVGAETVVMPIERHLTGQWPASTSA